MTRLSRLRGRSWEELSFRGRQFAIAALERHGLGDTRERAPGAGLRGTIAPDDWCRQFRARGGTGFHTGLGDLAATLAAARQTDPDGCAALVRTATRAAEGRFDLLGYRDLRFGNPIDWHLDPVAQVRAPRHHWSRVPYLDPAAVGDHKVVWEINRHQWLVAAALAWRLTGDERHLRIIAQRLDHWMDENPPKVGINWCSALEVGFRSVAWLWVLRLVGDAPAIPDRLVLRAVGHLVIAARHLERNLSTWFSPNTHLTGEALALYYLGHELRDIAGADRWRATGRELLLRWLPRHVRPDGTYVEQSTWYQRYTLDIYLHFLLLARATDDSLPPTVADAVGRLGEPLAWVARGDGTMPLMGDDDGGRLLFLDGRTSRDPRPALANAGLAAHRPFLCARGTVTAETLLLFGADATHQCAALAEETVAPPPSRHFGDGGLVVLRSGWEHEASLMAVDAGAHGFLNGGHAHADALAFDLSVRGRPLFVDPGTRAYTADPAIRNRYRATASHNAATVNGADSSEMRGAFTWGRVATTRVERFAPHPQGDLLVATHDGFGPGYRRLILRLPHEAGDLWIIRDTFEGAAGATLDVHYRCAPGIRAATVAGGVDLARDGQHDATLLVHGADLHLETGEVSSLYGSSETVPHLRLRRIAGAAGVTAVVGPTLQEADWQEERGGLIGRILAGDIEYSVCFGTAEPTAGYPLSGQALACWGRIEGPSVVWWRAVGAIRVAVAGMIVFSSTEARDADSATMAIP